MAIAFDAASNITYQGAVSSVTFSQTCSGSNRVLFVGGFCVDGSKTLTATYNSVSMTAIANRVGATGDRSYLFYLIAPDAGTYNVVVTLSSGTTGMHGSAASYTGVLQSGIPDASGTAEQNSTPYRISLTSVLDNCWMVSFIGAQYSLSPSAEAGTTVRTSNTYAGMLDSGAVITPAGSKTLGVTGGSPAFTMMIAATFPPAPASSVAHRRSIISS